MWHNGEQPEGHEVAQMALKKRTRIRMGVERSLLAARASVPNASLQVQDSLPHAKTPSSILSVIYVS